MRTLRIALLGSTSVTVGDHAEPLPLASKPLALLAYLAVESDRPHRREALAGLLWTEQPEERARHSLRQALVTMRAALGEAGEDGRCLAVTRQTLSLRRACDIQLDVANCQDALAEAEQHRHPRDELCSTCAGLLQTAVDHYHGEFLAEPLGIDSEAFDEWVRHQRERLHQRMLTALGRLVDDRERCGDLAGATALVRRQLELDPWREPAYRRLMSMLMRAGDRAGAMAAYARCAQVLHDELGIGPEAETTALAERIQRTDPELAWQAGEERQDSNLPVPLTSLVGRETELGKIGDLLMTPECRLITLVGPGGIGKTRLALEVARRRIALYRDGACFVPAETIRTRRQMMTVIADAARISLRGSDDPEAQLLRQLRDREMLVVLDNLEHLADAGAMVADLLAGAPRITGLATSRTQLNLAGEWVYELRGLPVPDDASAVDAGAPALFMQIARRMADPLPLDQEGRDALLRISRLVEGTPLALVMAAGWAPVLSLPDIAREIARGIDFLSTSASDVPPRHHSMRVVCDASWDLLTAEEREVYRRLSVFRSGFDREAAAEIAGATLPVLAALVAKSFLRRQVGGRYGSHELLRQYGEERLLAEPGISDEVHDRHCAWFSGFVARREMRLAGHQQVAALAEIGADAENVRAAWHWAVNRGRAAEISRCAHGLWLYHVIRGRMADGDVLFGEAVTGLTQTVADGVADPITLRALATALVRQGGFRNGLGHYEQARERLEAGISLLRELGDARELGLALNFLAATRHLAGNDAEEEALLTESRDLLARVGDRWALGYTLSDLGVVALGRGSLAAARDYCEQSRAIFLSHGDRRGLAFACQHLGEIAQAASEPAEAQRLLAESLRLRRLADDQWGVISSLLALGAAAREAGELAAARRHLTAALEAGSASQVWPVLLDVLVELALLMEREGRPRAAWGLLAPVLAHPSCNQRMREKAARLMPPLGAEHRALSAGEATERIAGLVEAFRRGAPPAALPMVAEPV